MNKIYIISILIIFQSCITQEINQSSVFNPIKEYEVDSHFVFNKFFINKPDSLRIEAWYISKENPEFNLIYFSGNGSNIRSAIPFFNELGNQFNLNIFSFNYSGYGLSEGEPSIEGIILDANIALDFYKNKIMNEYIPTIVLGYSLGGYVALKIANYDFINKIIIMSGFSSLKDLEKYLLKEALPGIIRPFLDLKIDKNIYKLDNTDLVQKNKKPILFLHGEKDDFIPPSMSYKLYNLSNSEIKDIKIIEKADHRTILKDSSINKNTISEINNFIYSDRF